MNEPSPAARPAAPFAIAILPVLALVGLLYVNVKLFGSGNNQVPLVLATMVAGLLAVTTLRTPWKDLEEGMLNAIRMAMQAILILMSVGLLIAAWIQAGVVPLLIVYGLELISPSVFLVTACIVCAVVSLSTGSSWTTAGTVGVALIGVGTALGIDVGMTAGAVVSGAYFGDKMSPLSDTTNLAPAMAGATLVEHIRHMIWTVTPALLVALVLYAFLGGSHEAGPDALERVDAVVALLRENFALSPWLLVPPVLVLVLVASHFPALPALLVGTFAAMGIGLLVQPMESLGGAVGTYFGALYDGYSLSLADPGADEARQAAAGVVTELLDGRGGMGSMMGTVALILCALSFGGVMESSGMLQSIADRILSMVRGTGSLITATIGTCLGVNVLASDQYMAIVVPGRMFRTAYLRRRLHPKNLSRALEDSGTVTSALIPWNTCGAQMAAVLGVATGLYWKFAFLNLLCPLISIAYGFLGFTIQKVSDEEAERMLAGD